MGTIEVLAVIVLGYIVAGVFLLRWMEREEKKVGNNYSWPHSQREERVLLNSWPKRLSFTMLL